MTVLAYICNCMNSLATDEKHELEIARMCFTRSWTATNVNGPVYMYRHDDNPQSYLLVFFHMLSHWTNFGYNVLASFGKKNVQMIFVSGSTIERDVDLGWSTSNIWHDVTQELLTQNTVGGIRFSFQPMVNKSDLCTFTFTHFEVLLEYA